MCTYTQDPMDKAGSRGPLAGQPAERALLPDLVRAVALIGIAVVNVQLFAWPLETGLYSDATASPPDRTAHFTVAWLAQAKFYALFSLMFGASLFYQEAAAARSGREFGPEQLRRLTGLGVIGLIHAIFLFSGDILVTYALLGALLLAVRGQSNRRLTILAVGFIAANILVLLAFAGMFAALDTFKPGFLNAKMATAGKEALAAFGTGGFLEAALYRLEHYSEVLPGILFGQGISTFGYFCIGLALARDGSIADPAAPVWSRARRWFLPAGLVLALPGAWLFIQGETAASPVVMLGLALIFLAAPLQALGYAGWLAAAAARPRALTRFVARAGQASLSAYLLQSVLMSFVFLDFGLGLYAHLTALPLTLIGLSAGFASIVFTSLWMARFTRGPVEMVFRAWTYGRR